MVRSLGVAVMMLILVSGPLRGAELGEDERGLRNKGFTGTINLVSGLIEIPMQTYKGLKMGYPKFEELPGMSKFTGGVGGLWRGVWHATGRLLLGAYQMAGFWTANPADNDTVGTRFDSEYAFDLDMPGIGDPDENWWFRMNKMQRGTSNLVGGLVEIPYQFYNGCEERRPFQGLGKGLWYAGSRLFCGAYELASFCFPSEDRTHGYIYHEERLVRE